MKHVLLVTVCPECDKSGEVIWLNKSTTLTGTDICRCGAFTYHISRDMPEVCTRQTAELVSDEVLDAYIDYIKCRMSMLDGQRAVEEAERIVRGER